MYGSVGRGMYGVRSLLPKFSFSLDLVRRVFS